MSIRLMVVAFLGAGCGVFGGDLDTAKARYQRLDYAGALQLLEKSSAGQTAAGLALSGQSAFRLGEYKQAIEFLQKAFTLEPRESWHALWLGRAWGRRAETSNPLAAPGYAGKARTFFEKAVELDPKNQEAVNDLMSYYLEAPGFLGGGLDKAKALAERTRANSAAEYHFALSRMAEKNKEYDVAERELRESVSLLPRLVGRLVDLAKFLAQRGKYAESDAVFKQAEAIAPASPSLVFGKAETYVASKRNLPEARRLLERYLGLPIAPEDPTREEAQKLLRGLPRG